MEFILKLFSKNRYEIILLLFIVLYIVYFTAASFLRYDNFYTGRFDLGNMIQPIWNTINGRIFEITDEKSIYLTSRLSGHADFLLILISPLYLIWQNPKMLLLIQTVVLSLGAYFVYLISLKMLKNKNFSLVLGICYLFNPAVQLTNLFDFHPVTLATTLLLGSFYFMIQKNYLLMTVFLILSGLSKENVWLITSFFGVYLFIKKEKAIGLSVFFVSILLFYYLIWIAIPNESLAGKHFAIGYYSNYGNSPNEIIKNLVLNPLNIFNILFGESQQLYIKQLLVPLGIFPIFSPFILIIMPELTLLLISQNSQLHEIYYQYSATLTPFLFISSIYAIKNFLRFSTKINLTFITLYILVFTLISSYLFGPLPYGKYPNTRMFTDQLTYRGTIEDYLSTIDKKYSVASTNNLGSHLSERRYAYTIPSALDRADYVLFLIRKPYDEGYKLEDLKALDKVKNNKNYIKVYEYNEFIVFKKAGLN